MTVTTRFNSSMVMAELLFASAPGMWDVAVYDPRLHCRLMAGKVFTFEKCQEYSRTGGLFCAFCSKRPQLRTIKQVREETMGVRGVCANFTNPVDGKAPCPSNGEERTLIAHGMCYACNGYGKKKAEGPDKGRSRQDVFKTVATEQAEEKGTITIKLWTDEDNALYERILEQGRRNRRGPGEELLSLAQTALEQGLDGSRVEIGKIRNIVERMKGYPLPNGSTKEVFQSTLQMVLERLSEMEDAA